MKTIIASQGQSIFDLAFICYGSYDVLKLMQEKQLNTLQQIIMQRLQMA